MFTVSYRMLVLPLILVCAAGGGASGEATRPSNSDWQARVKNLKDTLHRSPGDKTALEKLGTFRNELKSLLPKERTDGDVQAKSISGLISQIGVILAEQVDSFEKAPATSLREQKFLDGLNNLKEELGKLLPKQETDYDDQDRSISDLVARIENIPQRLVDSLEKAVIDSPSEKGPLEDLKKSKDALKKQGDKLDQPGLYSALMARIDGIVEKNTPKPAPPGDTPLETPGSNTVKAGESQNAAGGGANAAQNAGAASGPNPEHVPTEPESPKPPGLTPKPPASPPAPPQDVEALNSREAALKEIRATCARTSLLALLALACSAVAFVLTLGLGSYFLKELKAAPPPQLSQADGYSKEAYAAAKKTYEFAAAIRKDLERFRETQAVERDHSRQQTADLLADVEQKLARSQAELAARFGQEAANNKGQFDEVNKGIEGLIAATQRLEEQLKTVRDSMAPAISRAVVPLNRYVSDEINDRLKSTQALARGWMESSLGESSGIDALLESVSAMEAINAALTDIVASQSEMNNLGKSLEQFKASLSEGGAHILMDIAAVSRCVSDLDGIAREIARSDGMIDLTHPKLETLWNIEARVATIADASPCLVNATAVWSEIEENVLNMLREFYAACYGNRISPAKEQEISVLLKRMGIVPMRIRLNQTQFNPSYHDPGGYATSAVSLPPRTIVQVLEPGYWRVEGNEIIRRALVVCNSSE